MLSIEFLRQFRLGEYAIFDLAVTFIGIYLLSPLLSKIFRKIRIEVPRKSWLFLALPIGIVAHLLVGRMTPLTQNFLDLSGNYVLKIIIVGLLIAGFSGIKIIKKNNPVAQA